MSAQSSVMFIEGSQPMAHTDVRLVSLDSTVDGHVWRTDGEGRIRITLSPGMHTFEVGPERIPHEVEVGPKQPSLMIVSVLSATGTLTHVPSVTPALSGMVTAERALSSTLDGLSDRYAFERVLGRGGMGVVFKARDMTLDRDVAMKVLSEELREIPEAQHIFMAEARALAGLHHEHLVTVHDVTAIDGVVVMVFEFVEGASLEAWLKHDGRIAFEDLIGLTLQLVSALVYLHEQGVIHRDIKPANVLVREDGVLKIIDFGLARSLQEIALRGTRVRGTPAYMAPEQLSGEEVTPASDIYQLGITLYELLCGELPFTSGDMGYAHLHLQPEPLAERVPDAPEEFTAIVDACLSKDPGARPTARELLDALTALRRSGKTTSSGFAALVPESKSSESWQPEVTGIEADDAALSEPQSLAKIEPRATPRRRMTPVVGLMIGLVLGVGGIFGAMSFINTAPEPAPVVRVDPGAVPADTPRPEGVPDGASRRDDQPAGGDRTKGDGGEAEAGDMGTAAEAAGVDAEEAPKAVAPAAVKPRAVKPKPKPKPRGAPKPVVSDAEIEDAPPVEEPRVVEVPAVEDAPPVKDAPEVEEKVAPEVEPEVEEETAPKPEPKAKPKTVTKPKPKPKRQDTFERKAPPKKPAEEKKSIPRSF